MSLRNIYLGFFSFYLGSSTSQELSRPNQNFSDKHNLIYPFLKNESPVRSSLSQGNDFSFSIQMREQS